MRYIGRQFRRFRLVAGLAAFACVLGAWPAAVSHQSQLSTDGRGPVATSSKTDFLSPERREELRVLDANGGGFTTFQSSDTLFQSGKELEHCVGIGAGNGTVVVWDFGNTGLTCGLFLTATSTTNWFDRVSKSGESQLTCITEGFSGPTSAAGVGYKG